jgi:hypothetical protein
MRILRSLVPIVAIVASLWAQTTDKPLTNNEIESMLTAGLPEGAILMKIEMAAARGLVDLDASSSALIALKQKGAMEQVLNAVLWAEPFGAALKRKQEEARAVPGLPSAGGVYYRSSPGWVMLRSFLLWPPLYSTWNFRPRRTHEYSIPLGGSHSELQIGEAQPTFYIRETDSGEAWQIIRITARDNERVLRLASTRDFFSTDRFSPTQVRGVQMSRVASNVLDVLQIGLSSDFGVLSAALKPL